MDAEARESINKSRRKAGKVVLNTKFCVSLDYDDFQQILKY